MGIRILEGKKINDGPNAAMGAVLYCSVSNTALPLMFEDGDEAERFLRMHGDIRGVSDERLAALFSDWVARGRRFTPTPESRYDELLKDL